MLDTAYRDHLERFVRKPPEPPALPAFSAINPPPKEDQPTQLNRPGES
ncbi:transposase, partial [Mycobacterium tuberculosis]